ncbi:MAG: HAD-IC family P-type ATPase [Longimicrobiales bacterium]|nr:HAD-IC family P-type ATPase [Longimicrobiales bacterium]
MSPSGDLPESSDALGRIEWHGLTPDETLRRLSTSEEGLDPDEVERRRARYGDNRLRRVEPVRWWRILADQFTSVVVLLLVAAAVVSLLIGERVESVAIAAVLAINAAIGFVVELRARRAMDALLKYEAPEARVRRSGETEAVDAGLLVPGDVVEIEDGDAVPADGRLLSSSGLRVNEAPLTGESLPVEKRVESVEGETVPVADRTSMIFSGTTVVGGRGVAVVTATGTESQIGRIGTLLSEVEAGETPLEERLDALGRRLVWLTLGVAAFVSVLGILRGADVVLMIETGVALAIAAVPEGLPAVATIALAVGLRRMARRNALVRRLAAVEALGSTTVVCTDKTGTLTAGKMTVKAIAGRDHLVRISGEGYKEDGEFFAEDDRRIDVASEGWLRQLLVGCALTTRAQLLDEGARVAGDPTDAALLVAARKAGLTAEDLEETIPRVDEIPFDTERRLSASIHEDDEGRIIYVKGAPDALLDRSTRWEGAQGPTGLDDETRERFRSRNAELADRGLRVIALARGRGDEPEELTFLGLAGILDPPAEGVEETIRTLDAAGVRTVVITGDQKATAEAIADDLGARGDATESLEGREISRLDDEELEERAGRVGVYSRVSPEDKVRIVRALQSRGEVVAMIGDGVNDAAALKKSDVGVAMGRRGTDVAKDAAAMVLGDDRFRTIGVAVEEGRVIFDNIRKFVFYLFSCNVAEVATIMGASLVGAPVPLLPLQILWLNLVTDTFPALALALEPAEPGVMERPPRDPRTSILSAAFVRTLGFYALLITGSTLVAFAWGLGTGERDRAVTVAFMTLALAQLFHLGNARSRTGVLSPSRIFANRWAVGSVPLVIVLQLLAVYWEPLSSLLDTVPLGLADWLVVFGLSLAPAVIGQTLRYLRHRGASGS